MQAPGSPEPQCAGSGEPHRAPPLPTLPAAAAPCTGVLEGHAESCSRHARSVAAFASRSRRFASEQERKTTFLFRFFLKYIGG